MMQDLEHLPADQVAQRRRTFVWEPDDVTDEPALEADRADRWGLVFGALRADLWDVDEDEIERAFNTAQLRFKAGTSEGGEWRRMSDYAMSLLKKWAKNEGSDDPLGDDDFSEGQLKTILKDFRTAAEAAGDDQRVARLTPPRAGRGEDPQTKVNRLKKLLYEDVRASVRTKSDTRAATRERAQRIAEATGTARLLAEVDELVAKGATADAIRERLDPALTEPEQLFAGADEDVVTVLRHALDSGDMAKLKAAITRQSTKSGIKPIGRAGTRATFDPDTMEGLGGAPEAGTRVQVVRRGSELTLPDGSRVQLEKAKVVAPVKAVPGKGAKKATPGASRLPSGGPDGRVGGRDLLADSEPGEFASRVRAALPGGGTYAKNLGVIAGWQGYDRKPAVGTAADVDRLVAAGGRELWRGTIGNDRASAADQQEQLRTGPVHWGDGGFGPGIYLVTDSDSASLYADGTPGSMVRGVLSPQARVIAWDDLKRRHEQFLRAHEDDPNVQSVFEEPSIYAAALGYDAISAGDLNHGSGTDELVVLNRGALTFSTEDPVSNGRYKPFGAEGSASGRGAVEGPGALGAAPLDITDRPTARELLGPEADVRLGALRRYTSGEYAGINRYLRGDAKPASVTPAMRSTVEAIDAAMDQSRLRDDIVVWRGVGSGRGTFGQDVTKADDLTGFAWTDGAYVSTSTQRSVADAPVVLRIRVPRGTSGIKLSGESGVQAESEILLDRGQQFRVVADHGRSNGGPRLLDVELIPAPRPLPSGGGPDVPGPVAGGPDVPGKPLPVSAADVRATMMGSRVPDLYLANRNLTPAQWRQLGSELGIPGAGRWRDENTAIDAINAHFAVERQRRADRRVDEGLRFLGPTDNSLIQLVRATEGDPERLRREADFRESPTPPAGIDPATASWQAGQLRAVADHIEASERGSDVPGLPSAPSRAPGRAGGAPKKAAASPRAAALAEQIRTQFVGPREATPEQVDRTADALTQLSIPQLRQLFEDMNVRLPRKGTQATRSELEYALLSDTVGFGRRRGDGGVAATLDDIARRASAAKATGGAPRKAAKATVGAEDAARTRQARIDSARSVADTLTELDQLVSDGASSEALVSRINSRRSRGLPDAEADRLIAAVQSAREVEVENQIRAAYREIRAERAGQPHGRGLLSSGDSEWVNLADIRERVGSDVDRADVDAALKRLNRMPDVVITPESNQRALTERDRVGALRLGGQDQHHIRLADASPRPSPLDRVRSDIAREHGLTPIGAAGQVETYDPARHEALGTVSGGQVRVVRPGYSAVVDGETVRLSKPVVEVDEGGFAGLSDSDLRAQAMAAGVEDFAGMDREALLAALRGRGITRADLDGDDFEPADDEDDPSLDDIMAMAAMEDEASRAAGHDVTPGHDELHHYWTADPEGRAKWVDSPKPWTTLVAHLTRHVGLRKAKIYASRWFIEVFGFASGSDANRVAHGHKPRGHRVGPG